MIQAVEGEGQANKTRTLSRSYLWILSLLNSDSQVKVSRNQLATEVRARGV